MRIRCRPWRQLRGEPPIHELTSWRHGQVVAKQLRKPVDIVKACELVMPVDDNATRLLAKQLRLYNVLPLGPDYHRGRPWRVPLL